MTKLLSLAPLLLLAAPALAVDGMAGVFGGFKMLDEDDWEPVEQHTAVGAMAIVCPTPAPVGIFASASFSWAEEKTDEFSPGIEAEYEADTSDLLAGPVFYKRTKRVAGYAGGGIAYTNASAGASGAGLTFEEDDSGVGFWLGGGVQVLFKDGFGVGLHAVYSKTEVSLLEEEAEAGGLLLAAAVGYHF